MLNDTFKAVPNRADAIHPGVFIRNTILTSKKLSIAEAAKTIGISRPNASKFFNGKAATSREMASRIERAFGTPARALLDMQAAYDATIAQASSKPTNVRAYVPPFLSIKANEIETWADSNIAARSRLAVLLRTFVHSTGRDLMKVDFPGNDDAERAGWDGFIECASGNPWIPSGKSGWEFGVTSDVKGKATGDFEKSVRATPKKERDEMTFVFVTPRRWSTKEKWISEAKDKNQWKDVHAYDASDLEQWFEQSPAAQTWFANEIEKPSLSVRSLERCWHDWAQVADPPLPGTLFKVAIDAHKKTIMGRLTQSPSGPTIIAADSVDEGLAFLAQLSTEMIEDEKSDLALHDRVLVFDRTEVFPLLAKGTTNFIAVTGNRDVEREFAAYAKSMHTIVVYPRNALNEEAHFTLAPINYESFRAALEGVGFTRDKIERCSTGSGRSLTVLRRYLSNVPALRKPAWAAAHTAAPSLVACLFAGAWKSNNESDRQVLSLLANKASYDEVEKSFQTYLGIDDAPVWSAGSLRGAISKIDLMFAIAGSITEADLRRFFEVANMVLGEDDPSLDLPEEDRWVASMYNKEREFSEVLRQGIRESVVLLSVHGNQLFKSRLDINLEHEVAKLVRTLLPSPLTLRSLEAQDSDLPMYAEAAPSALLEAIESDLDQTQPAVFGILRPVQSGFFGGCPRTGLLWALENLAWNRTTLPRVVRILARLSEIDIDDNWMNKPIASLQAIFLSWMPQADASPDELIKLLRAIKAQHPNVVWRICLHQIDTRMQTGHPAHKPKWRSDGYGLGEPFTRWEPQIKIQLAALENVLTWQTYAASMVCDLVEVLPILEVEHQNRIWDTVNSWAATTNDEDGKATVREKIRVTVLSRLAKKRRDYPRTADMSEAAKKAYQTLESRDIVKKYAWLFRKHWVDESADEVEDEDLDFTARDERVKQQRISALRDVHDERGLEGVFDLAQQGEAASQIGWLMVEAIVDRQQAVNFIKVTAEQLRQNDKATFKNLASGGLHASRFKGEIDYVFQELERQLSASDLLRLLMLAPFRRKTWDLVDRLEPDLASSYWINVVPDWIHDSDDENREAIERLLANERPRAAFRCIRYKNEMIDGALIVELLTQMLKPGNDKEGEYKLDSHDLERAFEKVDACGEISLDQKASLEFGYIEALAQSGRRRSQSHIPNLEKYIEAHPEFFVQLIVWTYKRNDGKSDPPDVAASKVEHMAKAGYRVLDTISRIPGHDIDSKLDAKKLRRWLKDVRDKCMELGRLKIADLSIGHLLANAPVGGDGVWPCEPVREVLEELRSIDLMRGVHNEFYNSRGVHWRGEGGDQERGLAKKYQAWADALLYSHPFIASCLHEGIVKTYEFEAAHQDMRAEINRRLS